MPDDYAASVLKGVLMFGLLGAYLLYRAKKKEQQKKDVDEWVNK